MRPWAVMHNESTNPYLSVVQWGKEPAFAVLRVLHLARHVTIVIVVPGHNVPTAHQGIRREHTLWKIERLY